LTNSAELQTTLIVITKLHHQILSVVVYKVTSVVSSS